MSGGQDFNRAAFVENADAMQARINENRRAVLDGFGILISCSDWQDGENALADAALRLFIVADAQGISLGEAIAARMSEVRS